MNVFESRRLRFVSVGHAVALAICASPLLLTQANPQRPPVSEPIPKVIVFRDVPIPMRDNVLLRADVYVPAGSGRRPTILIRTPYNRHSETSRGYRFFAEH